MEAIYYTRQLVRAQIRKIGYASAVNFSKSKQTLTLIELARAIDPDLPPILLVSILREDSVLHGAWEYFVRTIFVRCAIRNFPEGWMTGPKTEFRRADVYGSWCSFVGFIDESVKEVIRDRVGKENVIPKGWIPTGVEDEVIMRLFADINLDVPTIEKLGIGT